MGRKILLQHFGQLQSVTFIIREVDCKEAWDGASEHRVSHRLQLGGHHDLLTPLCPAPGPPPQAAAQSSQGGGPCLQEVEAQGGLRARQAFLLRFTSCLGTCLFPHD